MTSVITGDIIGSSRQADQKGWLTPLKALLHTLGPQPAVWEIYRGDSFQLERPSPEEALHMAIRIKSLVKAIPGMDVRMAIGVGEKNFTAARVSESNGEAFVFSGKRLEALKKEKQTMALQTPWPALDREMQVCLRLALIVMDGWTPASAELVGLLLDHPAWDQQALAARLGIAQSSVSERRQRAHYAEIMEMEALYREKIIQKTRP